MKINSILLFFCGLILFSCSSDDDKQNGSLNNSFVINGVSYELSNVYVNDENVVNENPSDIAIIMSNFNLLSTSNIANGVNYVYFDFQGVSLQTGTTTNISDYSIIENASFINSEINDGNLILDDTEAGLTATNTSVTINSLNSTQIDFDFTFTREDGEVITGSYSGNYTNLNQ